MAVTKVDIASRALVMIGANPIASFTDGTTEANVTNTIYEEIIESSIESWPDIGSKDWFQKYSNDPNDNQHRTCHPNPNHFLLSQHGNLLYFKAISRNRRPNKNLGT